ncbi:MAG: hypothetical protein AAF353_04495 [Pseudomonadota bacterium]
MNRDLQKAFDKELKKELNRDRRVWLFIALAIVGVLSVFTPIFSESVHGVTVEVDENDRSHVAKTRIVVKLDSGGEVAVFVDSTLDHYVDQRVEVTKMVSVVGMASYQFSRYATSDN